MLSVAVPCGRPAWPRHGLASTHRALLKAPWSRRCDELVVWLASRVAGSPSYSFGSSCPAGHHTLLSYHSVSRCRNETGTRSYCRSKQQRASLLGARTLRTGLLALRLGARGYGEADRCSTASGRDLYRPKPLRPGGRVQGHGTWCPKGVGLTGSGGSLQTLWTLS